MFGSAAEAYTRGRPGYPEDAVRSLLPQVPCAVADIGAGTGKLTSVLVALGCEVVAVEPDAEMRARIRGADARAGSAEAVPLEDGSVDAVVAGQAAHWFDVPRFVDEAVRVLRAGGTVGLLWNELDDRVETGAEFARIAHTLGAVYTEIGAEPPLDDARFGAGELREFPHVQRVDADALTALVSSFSGTILLGAGERASMLAELRAWVRARGGAVELPYVAQAWRFGVRAA